MAGQQVEQEHCATSLFNGVAQRSRKCVNQSAFNAACGKHEFALPVMCCTEAVGKGRHHRLYWLAAKCLRRCALQPASKPQLEGAMVPQVRRPVQAAPPIFHSSRVGANCRHRVPELPRRPQCSFLHQVWKSKRVPAIGQVLDALPAMTDVKAHAGFAQAMQPGSQQRCGFHVGGENTSGTADKSFDTQTVDPVAQCFLPERIKQWGDAAGTFAITGAEGIHCFGMGDVHAALAGHQEFPADRRHGVIDVYVKI